jgi:Fur family ferric uptake transcriptional regulator
MRRKTSQREAVRAAFDRSGRPLDAHEALTLAREQHPTIGIATVYRAVSQLVDDGWLKPVELPGEPMRYELADLEHHHHFHCTACGRVFDVAGCALHHNPHVPEGFRVDSHEIILYGQCAECARRH